MHRDIFDLFHQQYQAPRELWIYLAAVNYEPPDNKQFWIIRAKYRSQELMASC